jgi:hypothetical protein
MERKLLKKIIKEELLKEQILCHLISPKGGGNGGYMENGEAIELINKIWLSGKQEIKDSKKLIQFKSTIDNFRKDVNGVDTNNDTVNTYLHKLRNLIGCYSL